MCVFVAMSRISPPGKSRFWKEEASQTGSPKAGHVRKPNIGMREMRLRLFHEVVCCIVVAGKTEKASRQDLLTLHTLLPLLIANAYWTHSHIHPEPKDSTEYP